MLRCRPQPRPPSLSSSLSTAPAGWERRARRAAPAAAAAGARWPQPKRTSGPMKVSRGGLAGCVDTLRYRQRPAGAAWQLSCPAGSEKTNNVA